MGCARSQPVALNEGVAADTLDTGLSEEFPSKFEKADEFPFNNLPDEIIVNIFSYLNAQELCNNLITDSGVLSLVKLQSAHLQELKLHGAEITDASLYAISQCRDLRCLEISSCKRLTDQSLQYLKNCHNLEDLCFYGSDFTKAGLSAFFKSGTLAHLHSLYVSECIAINDDMVLDIVQW